VYRRFPTGLSRFIAALQAQRFNHLSEAAELYRGLLGREDRLGVTFLYGNLAEALHDLGEHREELEVVRAGAERFPASSYMAFREARALAGLGRVDEAVTRLRELSTLSPLETSRWLQVRGGFELRRHGHPDVGERDVRRGLHWFLGDDSLANQYAIARIRLWLGERDAAVRGLLALVEQQPENLDYVGHLGVALAAAGQAQEARDVEARIADWSEPYLRGSDLYWRAAISARLGDKERAVTLLEDAVARGYTFSYLHEDEDLRPLWDYPPFRELIEPKG
jgi:tetratricopeptide (TPR) repeat protein